MFRSHLAWSAAIVMFAVSSLAAFAADIREGDTVEVNYGGIWITATVTEVGTESLKAAFTDERQFPADAEEYFHFGQVRSQAGTKLKAGMVWDTADPLPLPSTSEGNLPVGGMYRPGDLVEVLYGGQWIPAILTEVGGSSVRASFEDHRQSTPQAHEYFHVNNIRPPAGRTPPATPDTPQEWIGNNKEKADPWTVDLPPVAAPTAENIEREAERMEADAGQYVGNWGLNMPAMAYQTETTEDDHAVGIRTITDWLTTAEGMNNYGALQIFADGSYRIASDNRKWSGQWHVTDTGIFLEHPGGNHIDGYLVYTVDGAPRTRCANCTGESFLRMSPIPSEVADFLTQPIQPSLYHGRWTLTQDRWEYGFVEIRPDGSYHIEEDGNVADGNWTADGEAIILSGAFEKGGRMTINQVDVGRATLTTGRGWSYTAHPN